MKVRPKFRRIGFVSSLLLTLGAASNSLAQDFEIEDAPAVAAPVFDLHESNFDRWVFGNIGNAGKSNSARLHLESLLQVSIGEVDRACSLTEAQKKQLALAGQGDIKHFLDKLAEARKVFDQLRHDQNNINAIYQETVPLAAILRVGLFGPDSIFSKSILSTLETDQAAHYREFLHERNVYRYQAKVKLAIVTLDQSIGMTADQRRRFIDLVLQETKPSDRSIPQYETYVVLLNIAKIPEAKTRQILDESRWKALSQQLQQAKGMELFLKQNGYLADSDPDAKDQPAEAKVKEVKRAR